MSSWLSPKRRRTSGSPNTIRHGQVVANSISEQPDVKGVFAMDNNHDCKSPQQISRAASYLAGTSSSKARESMALTSCGGGKQRATLPKKEDEGARKSKVNEDVMRSRESKHARQDSGLVVSHGELSAHFSHVNDLLVKHSEDMEAMATQQAESEQRIRAAVEQVSGRRSSEFMDLSHLWTYLDRIQGTVERLVEDKSAGESERPVDDVEFSSVLARLERLQDSVEENTAVMKAWLEEKNSTTETEEMPVEDVSAATHVGELVRELDITPLTDQMTAIQNAVETIASEMIAIRQQEPSKSNLEQTKPRMRSEVDSALFTSQLEDIRTSISEIRLEARSSRKVRFADPTLEKKLNALSAQLREVAAGQEGMFTAIRRLEETSHGSANVGCEHRVLPPPRKMGRRVVGYVYDC